MNRLLRHRSGLAVCLLEHKADMRSGEIADAIREALRNGVAPDARGNPAMPKLYMNAFPKLVLTSRFEKATFASAHI